MVSMAILALPSARTASLATMEKVIRGPDSRMIWAYCWASGSNASVVPKIRSRGINVKRAMNWSVNPNIIVNSTIFPNVRPIAFVSLAPMRREIMEPPPMPMACVRAIIIMTMGNTTDMAPMPRGPTHCPTKMVSTVLYTA